MSHVWGLASDPPTLFASPFLSSLVLHRTSLALDPYASAFAPYAQDEAELPQTSVQQQWLSSAGLEASPPLLSPTSDCASLSIPCSEADTLARSVASPPPSQGLAANMPLISPSDELPPTAMPPDGGLPLHNDADNLFGSPVNFPLPTPPLAQHVRPRAPRPGPLNFVELGLQHPHSSRHEQCPQYIPNSSAMSIGGATVSASKSPVASLITPPEEVPPFDWKELAPKSELIPRHSSSHSPLHTTSPTLPQQEPAAEPADLDHRLTFSEAADHVRSEPHAGSNPTTEKKVVDSDDDDDGTSTPRAHSIMIEGLDSSLAWLGPGIMAVASCVTSTGGYSGSLKVLSHALPVPTLPGHVYSHVIDTIRAQCVPGQLQWINLMHAVQGRLNFADLPSSPPATPGPPIGGEDYFTTKIFSSAVTTSGDDDDAMLTPRAASDRLLSAPGSIELSIVERYIPPSAAGEINNMFSIEHQSIVVDRLVELVPNGGCLCLIYPTRTGGEIFQREYLDPILDPMLRTMINMHGLSADFGDTMSQMTMVRRMLPFNALQARLQQLCETLNRNDAQIRARLHGVRGTFSVVYGAKQQVAVTNNVWSNWWVRQEKQRLQQAVGLYFVRGSRLPEDGKYQQAVLVQEVLSGLTNKASRAPQPAEGIEMGVFVIKRE